MLSYNMLGVFPPDEIQKRRADGLLDLPGRTGPAQAGRGYQDACAALAPGDPACRKCCAPAHVALRTAALETRWDSLVSCCGRRGAHPQRRFEITFFRPECPAMRAAADRGGCPGPEVPLRRARASNGTCACDPRSAAVNCGRGCGDEGVENRSY